MGKIIKSVERIPQMYDFVLLWPYHLTKAERSESDSRNELKAFLKSANPCALMICYIIDSGEVQFLRAHFLRKSTRLRAAGKLNAILYCYDHLLSSELSQKLQNVCKPPGLAAKRESWGTLNANFSFCTHKLLLPDRSVIYKILARASIFWCVIFVAAFLQSWIYSTVPLPPAASVKQN